MKLFLIRSHINAIFVFSAFLICSSCAVVLEIKDKIPGYNCGDGILDEYEECDGEELGANSCITNGFLNGQLSCNNDCTLNTDLCGSSENCGNGLIDSGEDCDGGNVGDLSCATFGFPEGQVSCNTDCTINRELCKFASTCGNSLIDANETCDSTAVGINSCISLGYEGGDLSCADTCEDFDFSACTIGEGDVGASCKTTADCSILDSVPSLIADCINLLDVMVMGQPQTVYIPGGYCTATCDLGSDMCGDVGDCVDGSFFELEPSCLLRCIVSTECRIGYNCQDLGTGDGKRYCFPPLGK
jgi:hypothetical protein